MPAQSPTLSPTLSAMVAGLRGSSSGMPASTLPTRSAPTSAALVKMPPPTRRNRASSEPPKPNPTRIADAVFWNIMMIAVAPSRPEADREHAGDAAGAERDLEGGGQRSALGCGGRAHVAPGGQRHADEAGEARTCRQPATNASVRKSPDWAKRQRLGAVGLVHRGGGEEHDHGQRDEDHCDRAELALEVGQRALLDRFGDLDHLRRALILGEHALRSGRSRRRSPGGRCRRRRTARTTRSRPARTLVAAFGGEHVQHQVELPWIRGSKTLSSILRIQPRARKPGEVATMRQQIR